MTEKPVRITHWPDGFCIDWPSGDVGMGLSLAEVNLRLATFATGLKIEWTPRAQEARLAELKGKR